MYPVNLKRFIYVIALTVEDTNPNIFLGWKKNVSIDVIVKCKSFVIGHVKQNAVRPWYLCCVYGEPKTELRGNVWDELASWLSFLHEPFLLIRDFNQVEYGWEKAGYNEHRIDGAHEFALWKLRCELVDIPSKGPQFTWCNNRKGKKHTYERLDKAFGSKDWLRWFPNSGVKNFPIQLSDHAPIEFSPNLVECKAKRPYKLEAWNFEFEEAVHIINSIWKTWVSGPIHYVVARKLARIRSALRVWSLQKKLEWRKNWSDFDEQLKDALGNCFLGKGEEEYGSIHDKLIQFTKAVAIFWRQKAKIRWEIDGDTCTKYFFNWVKGRSGSNFILGIKKDDDSWTFDSGVIGELFGNHFKKLYYPPSDCQGFDEYSLKYAELFRNGMQGLSSSDQDVLNKPFSKQEVRKAVFQLGEMKSPGPDGIPALFYQRFWHTVKKDVTQAVLSSLNSGRIPKEFNKTMIVLIIPKVATPETVDNFRPISLCNSIMKIITKCIANRLRTVMDRLVGNFQNAFIKGRSISDIILIAHEVLRAVKLHRKGKLGRIAMKIDMSKAYDRLNWNFVRLPSTLD